MDGLRALSTMIFQWMPFSRDALEFELFSTRADGSVVSKVGPVDVCTESQVNLTDSSDETVLAAWC